MLPIEFARISQDGRLTLVIKSDSKDQPTFWALSQSDNVEDARRNLKDRERSKTSDIHFVHRDGSGTCEALPAISQKIAQWAAKQADVDAVVWTGLPCNWKEKRGRDFDPEDAVAFLANLEAEHDRAKAAYDRAQEYLTNTPKEIDTAVRSLMRERGWNDTTLSSVLFDLEAKEEKPQT